MSWNYRVIHSVDHGEDWYAIHEVYYDSAGTPVNVTADPVGVAGATLEELRDDLVHYQSALEKPVLEALVDFIQPRTVLGCPHCHAEVSPSRWCAVCRCKVRPVGWTVLWQSAPRMKGEVER